MIYTKYAQLRHETSELIEESAGITNEMESMEAMLRIHR